MNAYYFLTNHYKMVKFSLPRRKEEKPKKDYEKQKNIRDWMLFVVRLSLMMPESFWAWIAWIWDVIVKPLFQ